MTGRRLFIDPMFLKHAALVCGLMVFLAGCEKHPEAVRTQIATIDIPVVDESSGIAFSHRTPNLLWTHNDSDGEPVLYGFGLDGKPRGAIRLEGVKNTDWEDMASFELDGRSWLIVGDIGENITRKIPAALYVVAEPSAAELSPDHETVLPVAWTIPVRYADGPHDGEALAVDVREQRVYLIRKREEQKTIFTLPLRPVPAGDPAPQPQRQGVVMHIPQPNSEQRSVPIATGRYRASPTAMDISPDGRRAVVLTYGDVLLYTRRPGETWAKVFAGKPVVLPPHGLEQAEAVCFSLDGRALFVTEDHEHSPLLRYDLTPLSP